MSHNHTALKPEFKARPVFSKSPAFPLKDLPVSSKTTNALQKSMKYYYYFPHNYS